METKYINRLIATVIWVTALINPGLSCEDGYTAVTLDVDARYYQRSLTGTSSGEYAIDSTSSFKSEYESLDVAVSVGGGYSSFFESSSASASASVSKVTESASSTSEHSETYMAEQQLYNQDFLQIIEIITYIVNVNSQTATVEESNFVDSVPVNNSLSDDELHAREAAYISRYYGDSTDGQIINEGVSFTESKCVKQRRCFETDINREGSDIVGYRGVSKGSAEDCQKFCETVPSCTYFTWLNSKLCYLKYEKPRGFDTDTGATSGLKISRSCTGVWVTVNFNNGGSDELITCSNARRYSESSKSLSECQNNALSIGAKYIYWQSAEDREGETEPWCHIYFSCASTRVPGWPGTTMEFKG